MIFINNKKSKSINKKQIKNSLFVKNFNIKDIKQKKEIEKKENLENCKFFNLIKGYVPSLNIIINDLNDYIIMIQVYNFESLKYIIDNMQKLKIKELQIFNHKGYHYLSIKFDVKVSKKGNVKFDYIKKFIKDFEWRKNEFRILRLPEIMVMVKEKVYRDGEINYKDINGRKVLYVNDIKLRDIIKNDTKSKELFQKNILAKNVKITDEYITFNNDENIKNQVLGLQMYPSFLYKGYLTELNNVKNVETCTYIKTINIDKCLDSINNKQFISNQENIIENYLQKNKENSIKMFNTTFYIHIFGTDEEIKKTKEIITKLSYKYHIILNDLIKQQRRGYVAFLPLMNNKIKSYRAVVDYDGILPFNENIIRYFRNGKYYGKELITNNDLFFNRFFSGVILSSDNSIKENFMEEEAQDLYSKYKKNIYKLSFKETDRLDTIDLIKTFVNFDYADVLKKYNLDDNKMYIIFKMYLYICLSQYKDNIQIDINDKTYLDNVFNKLDEKIESDNENVDFKNKANRVLTYLNKNNVKLYNKINKEYQNPNSDICNYMKVIFEIFKNCIPYQNKLEKFIYVYEIQEITDSLDILFNYIFSNIFGNVFLFSSSNDFQLLNNQYVSEEMFKAKYINILEIDNNDISKIKNYLKLPNEDIIHLNNKKYITGVLYTNICEFNYYLEKGDNTDSI